jgi:programmed cell death protein 5
MSEKELEEIRKRRLLELQRQYTAEEQKTQMERQVEQQKQTLLRKILTPKARQRLANLKIIKPEFAKQLELQLIQLAQGGKLPLPLTDPQLKELLIKLQVPKRQTTIRRV